MATLGDAIYSILTTDGTVSGLVGTRVHPMMRGQEATVPAVTYTAVGGTFAHKHEAAPTQATVRVQLDSFGATPTAASALAEAVKAALTYATGTHGGFELQRCRPEGGPVEDFDLGSRVFRISQDFNFVYREGQ